MKSESGCRCLCSLRPDIHLDSRDLHEDAGRFRIGSGGVHPDAGWVAPNGGAIRPDRGSRHFAESLPQMIRNLGGRAEVSVTLGRLFLLAAGESCQHPDATRRLQRAGEGYAQPEMRTRGPLLRLSQFQGRRLAEINPFRLAPLLRRLDSGQEHSLIPPVTLKVVDTPRFAKIDVARAGEMPMARLKTLMVSPRRYHGGGFLYVNRC